MYKRPKVTGFIERVDGNDVHARLFVGGNEYYAVIDRKKITAPLAPGVYISIPGRRDAKLWQPVYQRPWTETERKRAQAKAERLARWFQKQV